MGEPAAPQRYAAFVAEFTDAVGQLTADSLIPARRRGW